LYLPNGNHPNKSEDEAFEPTNFAPGELVASFLTQRRYITHLIN